MTIDVERVAAQPPPQAGEFPVIVGWTQAAMAVQAVLSLSTPVHLKMTIQSHEPLLIDFRHHAFSWSTPLEAFPVDVWILKTLARRYGLDDWRPAQLAQFGRTHFGPLAGLAQQFLFAWERAQKKAESREPRV